jgi:hypothetical protein
MGGRGKLDFSPGCRSDILGLVTRCFPRGIFFRLIRGIAIRQHGLSNRDLVQLGPGRAIAIDRSDDGIGFHSQDQYSGGADARRVAHPPSLIVPLTIREIAVLIIALCSRNAIKLEVQVIRQNVTVVTDARR